MPRKKPRSPGVSLRGRAAGFHRYDDETAADGGKKYLHHRVRQFLRAETRRIAAEETNTEQENDNQ